MQPSGADRKSKLQSFAAGRMDFGIPSGKSCAQSGARAIHLIAGVSDQLSPLA